MGGGAPKAVPVKSTTTSVQSLSPEQRELMNLAMPAVRDIAANPPTLFPGSTIAPTNALQTQAQDTALNVANTQMPQVNAQTSGAFGNLATGGAFAPGGGQQNTIDFLTNPGILDPSSNPHLQGAIQAAINPMLTNFTNTILPGIRGDAISSGQFGGSRQGVTENNAAGILERNIGDVSSTMASNAYGQGLGAMISGAGLGNQAGIAQNQAMTSALNFSPQMLQNMLAPAQVAGAVGDARQAQDQAVLTEEAQRYMAEQLIPFSVSQDIASLAYGMPTGTTTTNSQGTQAAAGGGGNQGLQTAGAVVGIVASIAAIF